MLHRTVVFYAKLIEEKDPLAGTCKFDVWPNDASGYRIRINASGSFCREGSDSKEGFCGSEPITYEELIDILVKDDNLQTGLDVVQDFIKKFFSWGLPERWSVEVGCILQGPISLKEYEEIEEIIKEDKEKTAQEWLKKVEEDISSGNFYRPTKYIKKAQEIWPEIAVAEILGMIEREEDKKNKEKQ